VWALLLAILVIHSAAMAVAEEPADSVDVWASYHVTEALADGLTPIDFPHVLLALEYRHSLTHWSTATDLLDRLASARPMDPLMAAEVRRLRAEIALDQGHPAAAIQLFLTSGGLTQWWSSPSHSIEELGDFSEQAVLPSEDTRWLSTPGTDPLGWVQLQGLAWPARRQMLYLATTVESDSQTPIAIRLGAAQIARVWLNGESLLTTDHPLRAAEDQVAVGAWLRNGPNTLIVAVASESADWWLRVRLTAPDGSALTGVREHNRPPLITENLDRDPPRIRTLESEIRAAVEADRPGARLALAALLVHRSSDATESGTAREASQEARKDDPVQARLFEWMVTSEAAAERDLLTKAIASGAPAFPARTELARWYQNRDLYFEAEKLLRDHLDNPAVQAAAFGLDVGRWGPIILDDAIRKMEKTPECLDILITLADWSAHFGRWKLLKRALGLVSNLAPGLPKVEELELENAARCGDGNTLKQLMSSQLARDPNQPELRIRLARLLASEDHLDEANSVISDGLDRCPNHIDLLMESAHLLHRLGHNDAATEAAHRVLEDRPQSRRAEHMLALLGEETEDTHTILEPDELWRLAEQADHLEGPNVVLLDHTGVRFLPGNLTEETVQLVWLVRDAEASRTLKRHHIPYVRESQRLRVLQARILRQDGSEISARRQDSPRLSEPELNIFYDTRLRVFSFDEIKDGDIIEISTVLTEMAEANETGAYEGGIIRLGHSAPTLRAEIELSGPSDQLPAWELAHLEGLPETTERTDGTVNLKWAFRDLPGVPPDIPPAPQLSVRPHLVYSNHPEWGDLADWYGRHVASRIRPSRQIEDQAKRLIKGAKTRGEKIARIYAFVTNEIRYVGLEFGEHRYRPFSADWVLAHRMGDCKDTAGLLVSLFSSIDIPARMVMVRIAALGPVTAKMALLEDFNHAIAYLPEDDLWLDGTAAGHDAFPPPGADQNAWVLVIDGRESRPLTTPTPGAGHFSSSYILTKTDNGAFDLVIRTADTGEAATRRRGHFGGSRNPLLISRWVQSQFPGAQIVGEPKIELKPGRKTAAMEVQATVERSTLVAGGGLKTYPGKFELDTGLMPAESRSTALIIPVRPDLEWTIDFRPGPAPPVLPDPVALDTPFGALTINIERHANGYKVTGRFRLKPGQVNPEDAPGLRSFLVTSQRILERPLEIP
jgi:tetratricopeptide (TPR) repeat protein